MAESIHQSNESSNDSDDEDSDTEPLTSTAPQSSWWNSLISATSSTFVKISNSVGDGITNIAKEVDNVLGIPEPETLASRDADLVKNRDKASSDEHSGSETFENGAEGISEWWFKGIRTIAETITPMQMFDKTDRPVEIIRELASKSKQVEWIPKRVDKNARLILEALVDELEKEELSSESMKEFTHCLPENISSASKVIEDLFKRDDLAAKLIETSFRKYIDDTTDLMENMIISNRAIDADSVKKIRNVILSTSLEVVRVTKVAESAIKAAIFKGSIINEPVNALCNLINGIYVNESEFFNRVKQLLESVLQSS